MNRKPGKTKKILSLLLAVIMLISALPLTVIGFAEETTYSVGDIIEFGGKDIKSDLAKRHSF